MPAWLVARGNERLRSEAMKKKIDITVFGCEPDEAEVFNKLSYEFGVTEKPYRKTMPY